MKKLFTILGLQKKTAVTILSECEWSNDDHKFINKLEKFEARIYSL